MKILDEIKNVYNLVKNKNLQLKEINNCKDIFNIYDKKGKIHPMQAITIYSIEKTGFNYIIYKELKKEKYYAAKFKGEMTVDLNTELDEKERKYADTVLNKIFPA